MRDLIKEQSGGADGLIAVMLIEAMGGFARVQHHALSAGQGRAAFQLTQ